MAVGNIRIGASTQRDAISAVAELHAQLSQPDLGVVIFFCSPSYDLGRLASALNDAFAGIEVIGCTTAGEIGMLGYQQDSLVGLSLARSAGAVVVELLERVDRFSIDAGRAQIDALRRRFERQVGVLTPANTFALLLIDGLSLREEAVTRSVHIALDNIPLAGGSAGDGLAFGRTRVFFRGRFHDHGAILALIHTPCPFTVFKTQHFERSRERMVVTGAIPATRTVTEINGFAAGREYARLVGLEADELTPMIFAAHPVMVRMGDAEYIRSIQRVNPDGSLSFFCAIDTGIVLTVANGLDVVDNLRQTLARVEAEIGPPQVVIGCDCILRRLEISRKNLVAPVSRLLARSHVIGFSTYGEQFNGMHVNQTFTGIAIGAPP